MERSSKRKNSDFEKDLRRLSELAYHRLESSADLVRKFRSLRKAEYVDYSYLKTLYEWLFVPITLAPIDVGGLLREALNRVTTGKRLDKAMVLLIEMLPSVPSARTQRAVCKHEHLVQHGDYQFLVRAPYKYDQIEAKLKREPRFQAHWSSIKANFQVTRFADQKGVIRRRLVAERSMREDWAFRWKTPADRFYSIFDVFCQRWHLYGMQGDRPLLLKLTVNLRLEQ